MLLALADAEAAKQDQKDEQIVDGQRSLDGVAGDEFKRRLASLLVVEPEGESAGREGHEEAPEPCQPGPRLILFPFGSAAVRQECVGHDQRQHRRVESDPPQQWRAGNGVI